MQNELPVLGSHTSKKIRQELEQSFHQQLLGLPSLDSILSQTVRNEPVLKRVDIFLQLILNHWSDVEEFITVRTEDVLKLFMKKKRHSSKWNSFKKSVKDAPYMIAEQLLRIAKKMNAMKLVLVYQNMVHLPKTSKDIKRLIESADDSIVGEYEQTNPKLENQPSSLHKIIAVILLRNRRIYIDTDHYSLNRRSSKNKGRLRTISDGLLKQSTSIFNDDEETEEETVQCCLLFPESSPTSLRYSRRKKNRIRCEGCGNKISLSRSPESIITYECGYLPNQLIFFHDIHCENLRKYKEAIRHYVCEEIVEANAKIDGNVYVRTKNTIEYGILLLKNFNLLINIENAPGSMPIPSQKMSKRRMTGNQSPTGFLGNMRRTFSHSSGNKNLYRYDDNIDTNTSLKWSLKQIREQRQIAVRLLSQNLAIHTLSNNSHQFFNDIPIAIQYSDFSIFGEILWIFVVQQLGSKQTDLLWILLAYISMQLSSVKAMALLNEYISELSKTKKLDNLKFVCTSIIEASNSPIVTSLLISGFMDELALMNLSRQEKYFDMKAQYIRVADHLVGYIESDHLLAILLFTPTDFQQMNVIDIAIKLKLDDFLDNGRVDRVMNHLWEQYDFLNPDVPFSAQEMNLWALLKFLAMSPSKFYYTPMGKYWISSVMYAIYVGIVTIVILQRNYLYVDMGGTEFTMWFCNLAYISFEMTEMVLSGAEYFSDFSNLFDTLLSLNWIALGVLRLLLNSILTEDYFFGYAEDFKDDPDTDSFEFTAEDYAGQASRNKMLNQIYMSLFCFQIIILYGRFMSIISRSRQLGPFVQMIISMIGDIASFMVILLIAISGFSLSVYFLVGTDTHFVCYADDVPDGSTSDLTDIQSSGLYVFQTLLGQQDWKDLNSNDCMSPFRSRMLLGLTVVFAILGTLLLLNLLIALMASTYELKRQATSKLVNFSRTAGTYQMAQRNALIAPPFNVMVYMLTIMYGAFAFSVSFLSCMKYYVNVSKLIPVQVNFRRKKRDHSNFCEKRCYNTAIYCKRVCSVITPIGPEFELKVGSIHKNDSSMERMRVDTLEYDENEDEDEGGRSTAHIKRNGSPKKSGKKEKNSSSNYELQLKSASTLHSSADEDDDEEKKVELAEININLEKGSQTSTEYELAVLAECELNDNRRTISMYLNPFDSRRRFFCRFCKCEMLENGKISDYFELFTRYRLDEDDTKILERILHERGVCPNCFQPYKIFADGTTNRVSQWEIALEIVSYYVFRVFVHIPMILCLLIPAMLIAITSGLSSMGEKSDDDDTNDAFVDNLHAKIYDKHYHSIVSSVIAEEVESSDFYKDDNSASDVSVAQMNAKISTLENNMFAIKEQLDAQVQHLDSIVSMLYKIIPDADDEDGINHKNQEFIYVEEEEEKIDNTGRGRTASRKAGIKKVKSKKRK